MIQEDINRFLSNNENDYMYIKKILDTIKSISNKDNREIITKREYIRRLLIIIAKNDKDFKHIIEKHKDYIDKLYGTHNNSKYFYNQEVNNIIID